MNTYEKAYKETKAMIERAIEGKIPNVKYMKKQVSIYNKTIKAMEVGVNFAKSLGEVERVEKSVSRLRGERDAYKDVLKWINKKLKEVA